MTVRTTLLFAWMLLMWLYAPALAQRSNTTTTAPVYVDKQGILRWRSNNNEATFFGVNYTVPFAYGYRSHQVLGVNLEKAIDQDVYHMARLGFNAFRVHVWDTEISDSVGNLLENEHLRLFDYLVARLKERNIKVLVTPIAFWGPGYPEKDQPTAGFSSKYNKQQAVTEEQALLAQENYLKQFFKHVNPYTNLTYQDDPDVIAAEVNNEPNHTGPKARTTEYVNRMVNAIRSTGWTKPVFYNISESPKYADAVAKANVDGFSFQWYPTGLVANRTLKGNYLPHVAKYRIPFDTIPQFANRALMVYEFDAGDIMEPVMYPAMARSFREAGFQWATQFAYDPLATAHANTEYQTHYVNLAYTPSKAISLLIASRVFHKLPRKKAVGSHPADTLFDVFRLSHKQSLSEMNTANEFYYANSTQARPMQAERLQHIAGVGSSAVIQYAGTGAYFADKLESGIWRLEVMPDAIRIRDPYGKASPHREVTRIEWRSHLMQVNLPGLGTDFSITAINQGNKLSEIAQNGSFNIQPGTYLLTRKGKAKGRWSAQSRTGVLGLAEFVAPLSTHTEPFVYHEPYQEISAAKPFVLRGQVAGVHDSDNVSLVINNHAGVWKTIAMEKEGAANYVANLPTELLTSGLLNYRILVQKANGETYAFPGGHKGDPWAWDYVHNNTWQMFVASPQGHLELFNATNDRALTIYPNLWRSNERQLTASGRPGQLILKLATEQLPDEGVMGWQLYIKDKLAGRTAELGSFDKIVVRARTAGEQALPVKVGLITTDASAFTGKATLSSEFQDIVIPLAALQADEFMLLPRPYPGFHPFWFKPVKQGAFSLNQVEKLELRTVQQQPANGISAPTLLEVEAIWLEKVK